MITRSITLNNEIGEISRLMGFVEQIGEDMKLCPSLLPSLQLALEESVSNIILYAYPGETGKQITVEAGKTEDRLLFIITDSGTPFDPTQVAEADITLSAEERPVGGLGIFLVRKIMDEVEYCRIDGNNILLLKKKIY